MLHLRLLDRFYAAMPLTKVIQPPERQCIPQ